MKTWLREHYPTPVHHRKSLKRDALSNSLLKWTGVLVKNIEKHKVEMCVNSHIDSYYLREKGEDRGINWWFTPSGHNCHLCQWHRCHSNSSPWSSYKTLCPIEVVTGRTCSPEWTEWSATAERYPWLDS